MKRAPTPPGREPDDPRTPEDLAALDRIFETNSVDPREYGEILGRRMAIIEDNGWFYTAVEFTDGKIKLSIFYSKDGGATFDVNLSSRLYPNGMKTGDFDEHLVRFMEKIPTDL